ncbi:MAG: hypothetical protein JXB50_00910 [Spirochaetes bacterium]|nr:hypothetical protein [Spirochaetota bacterium]
MKLKICIVLLFITTVSYTLELYENYIEIIGEGPLGQHLIAFDKVTYSKEDAVRFAKKEIFEFLTGLVYGYNYKYKVENNINKQKGYFELTPIGKISEKDKNLTLNQYLEKLNGIKIQAVYRLNENQKTYIRGFQSSIANFSVGDAYGSYTDTWDKRIMVYKDSLRSAVLSDAKKRLKSRPLFIKGKIFLKQSPQITVVSGQWRVVVKAHVIMSEVKYEDVH